MRVGVGLLPGGRQQADALQRHVQAGGVHHHEHCIQALAGRADDPAARVVEAHDAGGRAVQAHFFLDALAHHGTARAVGVELRHQEQRQALGPRRCVGQAGQHQVHDVVGQIVLAAADEDLGAVEQISAVGLRQRAGGAQAQVAAGVRLGQAHGGQPFVCGDLLQVLAFQRLAAVVLQAFVGAVQQAGRHGPAVVGGGEAFVQRRIKHCGQALAAVFGRGAERRPAGLPEGLVGVAKAGRHGDGAAVPLGSDLVAHAVERGDAAADELAHLIEQLAHQRLVGLGEGGQGGQLPRRLQHIEQDVVQRIDGDLVGVHGLVK